VITSSEVVSDDRRRERTEALYTLRSATEDPVERARIEDDIIRVNLQMATDATRRFRDRGVPADDVQQIAHLGLVKAVRRFDPDLGHDFLSYAVPTIRGEVLRYFRDKGWMVRPGRAVQEAQSRVFACEQSLYQRLGRAPRPSEIADHLDLDLELVVEAIGATGCFSPASLDVPLPDAGPRSEPASR
jgi:RNA polymerase sigma-B factor